MIVGWPLMRNDVELNKRDVAFQLVDAAAIGVIGEDELYLWTITIER